MVVCLKKMPLWAFLVEKVNYSKQKIWVLFQSLSHVWLFVTPRAATCQASLSFTTSCSLLKLMSVESVMPSNHLCWLDSKRPECIITKWEKFQGSAGRLGEELRGQEQKSKECEECLETEWEQE